jgi:hypothetical protein
MGIPHWSVISYDTMWCPWWNTHVKHTLPSECHKMPFPCHHYTFHGNSWRFFPTLTNFPRSLGSAQESVPFSNIPQPKGASLQWPVVTACRAPRTWLIWTHGQAVRECLSQRHHSRYAEIQPLPPEDPSLRYTPYSIVGEVAELARRTCAPFYLLSDSPERYLLVYQPTK